MWGVVLWVTYNYLHLVWTACNTGGFRKEGCSYREKLLSVKCSAAWWKTLLFSTGATRWGRGLPLFVWSAWMSVSSICEFIVGKMWETEESSWFFFPSRKKNWDVESAKKISHLLQQCAGSLRLATEAGYLGKKRFDWDFQLCVVHVHLVRLHEALQALWLLLSSPNFSIIFDWSYWYSDYTLAGKWLST